MSHREVFKFSPKRCYLIPHERTCYLDTGVIRRRLKSLDNSPLANSAYTSALTIVELVGRCRVSDGDFRVSRTTISTILSARIPVDWRLPDVQSRCAFPSLRPKVDIYETRTVSLKTIVKILCTSEKINELNQRLANQRVDPGIEYFENYDTKLGTDYLAAMKDERSRSKKVFDPDSLCIKKLGLSPEITHDEYIRLLQGSELNYIMSRGAMIDKICMEEGFNVKEHRSRLWFEYDGSIDPYLRGLGWWHFDQTLGRTAGRNDGLDLAHLLYLVPNSHLVTSDRSFSACADKIGVSVIGPNSPVISGG